MSPILSTLLFAASATAQLTTSIWIPSSFDPEEVGFYGSVVDVKDDKTTIALTYDNDTNTDDIYIYESQAETVTLQGSTWVETVTTTTESFEDGDMTYSLGCKLPVRTRAKPTCTYSMNGELAYKSYCSDYQSYTDVYTSIYEYTYTSDEFGPATTETYTQTIDYQSYVPDFCSAGGSLLPDSIAVNTMTMSRSYIETYQVVITAGAEKLSAGATPTGTNAQPTGTQGGNGGNGTSTSLTAAAAAPENTGAAAPMITQAPVLAGLGALAMAALAL